MQSSASSRRHPPFTTPPAPPRPAFPPLTAATRRPARSPAPILIDAFMPRKPDSGRIDLIEIFRRVQAQMLSDLSVGGLFEHATSAGTATEHHWINLFERYLPRRYRAAPAFIIDADGGRSRQIDIAIFDNLYSPPLFPHEAGLHLPAESVYAVFEVKPTISKQWLRDAAEKAASVRALRRTSAPIIASGALRRAPIRPQPILAGLLATSSVWSAETFGGNVRNALQRKHPLWRPNGNTAGVPDSLGRIDLGCSLQHGAFENAAEIRISDPDESLIFFVLRLLDRLREMGTAPATDLREYGRCLRSFQ